MRLWLSLLVALGLGAPRPAPPADLTVYRVTPQDADPAVHRFNEPHYIVFDRSVARSADLLVFMSGSGAKPVGVSDFLDIAASEGYRVISLAYNDLPAVIAVCARDPDPSCSEKVRRKRAFGDDVTGRIDDSAAESIVNRLVKVLLRLERDHPSEGWEGYLDGGSLKWDRLVLTGHSQGAGMAAFIAQRKRVARVVLFSSPWDFHGRGQQLAPWILAGSGVTPFDLWFGAYHKKENTADLIARAYRALGIPSAHVQVLTLEPARVFGDNPYHLSVLGNGTTPRERDGSPSYADIWRSLVGRSR